MNSYSINRETKKKKKQEKKKIDTIQIFEILDF